MIRSKCFERWHLGEVCFEKKKEVPMEKILPSDLLWLFIGGSLIGFVLEGLWHILKTGYWESHTATVWGPFCLIYGIATALIYPLSHIFDRFSLPVQFMIYGVIGSAIEYFGSLFQELIFGFSSWDYSDHFLHIGGRISLWMTLLWGALGVVFARFIFPHFKRVLHKMRGQSWNMGALAVAVFMSLNLIFTAMTVLRWNERQKDIPASNVWEEYADEKYNDEKMQDIFPNWTASSSE